MKVIVRSLQDWVPTLLSVLRAVLKYPYIRYSFRRPPSTLRAQGAFTVGEPANDTSLIDRLVTSYLLRTEAPTGLWSEIFLDLHGDIHHALTTRNRARIEEFLRNPISSDLLFGFDSTVRSLRAGGLRIEDRFAPALALDALVSFAEALGVRRVGYPDSYRVGRMPQVHVDDVLEQIEVALGFALEIPNPYPAEYGLRSIRGVISYRVPQAIYQAWRISQLLAGIPKPKVLEIGGGLGRTAFYARRFGIQDYTILDIPVTSLAQGYFLGRSLGEEHVRLVGENAGPAHLKLQSPASFLNGQDRYDLIVNVDSLTELGRSTAEQYWAAIRSRTGTFLSINHEANEFTVAQLVRGQRMSRMPYWMRRGYVEEMIEFRSGGQSGAS